MKKHFFLIFLAFGTILNAQTRQKDITDSRVERVTVFLNGAQVFRTAQFYIESGKTELVFKGLPAGLNAQSVQVRGEGNFSVLSVTHRLNYLSEGSKPDSAAFLQRKIEELSESVAILGHKLTVLTQEEQLLQSNRVQILGGANTHLKIDDLKQMADYQRDRMTDILAKKHVITKELSTKQTEISILQQQNQVFRQIRTLTTSEMLVVVSAKQGTSAKFELNYLVPQANWFPSYDMRVTDIGSPIELLMNANVTQSSGEDWKDVKLTLSTSNPSESNSRPNLSPWRLGINYQPQQNFGGQVQPGFRRNPTIMQVSGRVTDNNGEAVLGAVVRSESAATQTDMDGNFSLKLNPSDNYLYCNSVGYNNMTMPINTTFMNIRLQENTAVLEEVVVTSASKSVRKSIERADALKKEEDKKATIPIVTNERSNPTATLYEIELPYTILSDAKQNAVEIKTQKLPATYQYFVAPKLDKDVFLTAEVRDWEQYNLLSGEAKLYMEGSFVGKTFLNVNSVEDTLTISLGRDKNVVVSRAKLKDFSKTSLLSSTRKESRGFEITVRNKKNLPINLIIEDQIPISTNKSIEVEHNAPNAQLDAETGILRWKMTVEPQREAKNRFDYKVTYPKNLRIALE